MRCFCIRISRSLQVAVLVKNCPCFLFNRLLFVYMDQAHRLLFNHGLLPQLAFLVVKKNVMTKRWFTFETTITYKWFHLGFSSSISDFREVDSPHFEKCSLSKLMLCILFPQNSKVIHVHMCCEIRILTSRDFRCRASNLIVARSCLMVYFVSSSYMGKRM